MNFDSEINIMQLIFVKKHYFLIQNTTIDTQKINSSRLAIFEIVIAFFLIDDKDERS